jgi:translation initiation factor 2 subunit 2
MEYDEMLDRAIAETPDVTEGDERLDLPDPEVREEGKVTVVENFRTLCGQLGREPGHLLQFLQAEVGTSGHIDESGRARITGSFGADRIGDAVDSYTDAFVRCSECGLPDTRLERENGVELLRCEACGARSATPDDGD